MGGGARAAEGGKEEVGDTMGEEKVMRCPHLHDRHRLAWPWRRLQSEAPGGERSIDRFTGWEVAGCIRLRLGWRERMTCGVHYYGQFNLKSLLVYI